MHDVLIVGGCGHVGLPLGLMLAKSGLQVALHDHDPLRKQMVRDGRMPFLEYGAEPILADVLGRELHVVDDMESARGAEYIVITIGTPIDEYLNPRYEPLYDVADQLAPLLGDDQHLVLRSTVFPGSTRELGRHLEARGCDAQVSYCPERIAQGYAISELDLLPQIVSGLSDVAVDGALRLFGHLTTRTIEVSVEEAELAKLFLNSWRYIQFAIANQFYMLAESRGLDFFRIHEAMTNGYDRAADFPLPGLTAGPCLLKDTMQLSALNATHFQLGHTAMLINEGLPNFIIEDLRARYALDEVTVGILGVAFKANIDDVRDSLAFKLRKLLMFHRARVLLSDVHVQDDSLVPLDELLSQSDIVIVGAPHDEYRGLDFRADQEVVDIWGFTRVAQGSLRA